MLVDVAADEHRIDLLVDGDLDHLAKCRRRLVEPLAAGDGLADVPVGGMEEPHRSNRSNGSRVSSGSAASL